jgi:uncharacterized protein (DUF58 family)
VPKKGSRLLEGDEISLTLELRNRRPWPIFGLTATAQQSVDDSVGEGLKFYFPFISPRSSMQLDCALASTRFGRATFRIVATSDAPFGLFRRSKRFSKEVSILVLPAPRELARGDSVTGEGRLSERAFPTAREGEVAGSRPYSVGDPARHIHWRASARSGRMMTKSFTAPTEDGPVLILGAGTGDRPLLDDVVRVAAGAGRLSMGQGGRIRLRVGDMQSEVAWDGLLRRLALLSDAALPPLANSLQTIDVGAAVLAVLPRSDAGGLNALRLAAPRAASLGVWLLADAYEARDGDDVDVQALRRAGATVTYVETSPITDPDDPAERLSG